MGDQPTKRSIVGDGKPITTTIRTHVGMLALYAVLAGFTFYLDRIGVRLGQVSDTASVCNFLQWVLISAAVYELVAIVIHGGVHLRHGSSGEVRMLTNFCRVVAVIVVVLLLLSCTGKLKQLGAVMGAFAGMLLGWSLQAPVSGVAAWVLINLKRPFRLGDRVQFPSLGLSGDVLEVGLMYTKLDQVGGSIGSEDAIGRHILIPNAMLFGQVCINYTPQAQSAYFLDEVVIRLTYDSDMAAAECILLNAAKEVTADIINATGKEPYVRSDLYDYGVYVRLRYMTLAMDRPRMSHQIVTRIFNDFQRNPRVDFAIPFVYSYRKGVEGGGHGSASAEPILELPLAFIDDPQEDEPLSEDDRKGVVELAERFKTTHLIQPLTVRPVQAGRYELVSGRFRFLAAKHLGWQTVPAITKSVAVTADSIEAGNEHRLVASSNHTN